MKKQLITILIFVIAQALYSQTTEDAWINEIHYDNNGADSNEGIEIVVKDVSTYPLANWSIILYNGSNGETYNTFDYSVPNSTSSSNGFTIAWKEQSSIQNDVEGVALGESLLEFPTLLSNNNCAYNDNNERKYQQQIDVAMEYLELVELYYTDHWRLHFLLKSWPIELL